MDQMSEKEKKKNKAVFLKQIQGISTFLDGSSSFWKGTLSKLGNNFCECNRIECEALKPEETNNQSPIYAKTQEADNLFNLPDGINNSSAAFPGQQALIIPNPEDSSDSMSKKTRIWIPSEDAKLLIYANQYTCKNWKRISMLMKTKTPQQCAYRYRRLMKETHSKAFNMNDDLLLIDYTEKFGRNWELIAKHMKGRSPEELKNRYERKLDPKLKRSKFTKEEDVLIRNLQKKFGNQWNEIAKYLPDRNASMIKNRYYSFIRKSIYETDSNKTLAKNNNISEISSLRSTTYYEMNSDLQDEKRSKHTHNEEDFSNTVSESIGQGRNNVSYTHSNMLTKSFYKSPSKESKKTNDYLIYEENYNINDSSKFTKDLDNDLEDEISLKIESLSMLREDTYSQGDTLFHKINNQRSQPCPLISIDECEENILPSDLVKINTDSPKEKTSNEMHENDFHEQYQNVFRDNNNLFDQELNTMYNNLQDLNRIGDRSSNSPTTSALEAENSKLKKVFTKLEEVLTKLDDFGRTNKLAVLRPSEVDINTPINEKGNKILELDRKVNEKRENLITKLTSLKEEYVNCLSQGNEQGINDHIYRSTRLKNSKLKQIELLIELINISKLKILLMKELNQISS